MQSKFNGILGMDNRNSDASPIRTFIKPRQSKDSPPMNAKYTHPTHKTYDKTLNRPDWNESTVVDTKPITNLTPIIEKTAP